MNLYDLTDWLIKAVSIKTAVFVCCDDWSPSFRMGCRDVVTACIAEQTPLSRHFVSRPKVLVHDFSLGKFPFVNFPSFRFDFLWGGELVPYRDHLSIANMLPLFSCARIVSLLCPSEMSYDDLRNLMAKIGYGCDDELTLRTRELAGKQIWRDRGMLFSHTLPEEIHPSCPD